MGEARRRASGDIDAVERDGPRVGRLKAAEHVDERRLAGAVGADQPERLAGLERQVDVLEDLQPGEGERDALGPQGALRRPIVGRLGAGGRRRAAAAARARSSPAAAARAARRPPCRRLARSASRSSSPAGSGRGRSRRGRALRRSRSRRRGWRRSRRRAAARSPSAIAIAPITAPKTLRAPPTTSIVIVVTVAPK